MDTSRRSFSLAALALIATTRTAFGAEPPPASAAERMRTLVELPVNEPWLILGQSKKRDVERQFRDRYSDLHPPVKIVADESPVISGGSFLIAAQPISSGLIPEEGPLQFLETSFDPAGTLAMVRKMFVRGREDDSIDRWRHYLQASWGRYGQPGVIHLNGDSEDEDYVVMYAVGAFVVEMEVPEIGSLATVTYSKRDISEKLHQLNGSYEAVRNFFTAHPAKVSS